MDQNEKGSPTLSGIWRTYRLKIIGTFSLISVERLLYVAYPFALGVAIDDLIEGSYFGVSWLLGLLLLGLIVGVGRRLYDTRVYTGIYNDIADATAGNVEISVARRAAHLQLARELTDFFEWQLPELLASLIGITGAFLMLLYLLPSIGGLSLTVALLIGFVFFLSRNRIRGLNTLLNNELERQVTMLESPREFSRRLHLRRLRRWKIHLSDLEAANFGVADMLLAFLIVGAVVITVKAGLSVG
ncbi:MAG: ABC transporter six-transmembrane domain-containing protein, partial [Pseudomonadota bacterium]